MFERLTNPKHGNVRSIRFPQSEGKALQWASRLAAYEDSGLSPEEVQKLKKSDASKEQCTIDQHGEIHRLRDELKRYKQAEQEGRLVVLPCKVGDVVYWRSPFGSVASGKVSGMRLTKHFGIDLQIESEEKPNSSVWREMEKVFLTREEAEKALGGGE